MEFLSRDKPLAIVTSASSGMGYELAKQFAQHGYDLIIVSENPAIVEAAQVCKNFGAEVESYIIDLSKNSGVMDFQDKITKQGRKVEVMSFNNSVGIDEINIINLNVISTVRLAKYILKDMLMRRSGKILFTTKMETDMPDCLKSVYLASNSFIKTFAETTQDQIHGTGVTIKAFSSAIGSNQQTANQVAEQSFQYLMAKDEYTEDSWDHYKSEELILDAPRAYGEAPILKH